MPESSIPVSEKCLLQLQELSQWKKVPIEELLIQAIKEYHDRAFWEAVNAGYAALRADPAEWAEVEAERRLWDRTLLDGLDPSERWTAQGDVLPPSDPGQTT